MVTVRGVTARLTWGYHVAATLGAWTVTQSTEGKWMLTAIVVSTDTFRVAQRPLVFEVPTDKGVWRWPIVALQITGASLTATLGPKET